MPKYDAFGREIGEDTLSGLGGDPSAAPQPVATPLPSDGRTDTPASVSASPIPSDAPAAPAQPSPVELPGQFSTPTFRRRRSGGFGCLVGLVFLAIIVAGPVIALVSFVDDAENTFDSITDMFEPDPSAPGSPAEPADAPPPVGVMGRSMIAPKNLARGLATLRLQELGSLGRLLIYPDRVNGELITRKENRRNVVVLYDGEIRKGEPVDLGSPQVSIPWTDVDPGAPARLVRASAAKYAQARPERIDYLIASPDAPFGKGHQWVAYFKGGVIVQGDARGRVVRRID